MVEDGKNKNTELTDLEKGNLLQKEGNFQDALYCYNQAHIKLLEMKENCILYEYDKNWYNFEEAEIIYQEGIVYEKLGKNQIAKGNYKEALKILSDNDIETELEELCKIQIKRLSSKNEKSN